MLAKTTHRIFINGGCPNGTSVVDEHMQSLLLGRKGLDELLYFVVLLEICGNGEAFPWTEGVQLGGSGVAVFRRARRDVNLGSPGVVGWLVISYERGGYHKLMPRLAYLGSVFDESRSYLCSFLEPVEPTWCTQNAHHLANAPTPTCDQHDLSAHIKKIVDSE